MELSGGSERGRHGERGLRDGAHTASSWQMKGCLSLFVPQAEYPIVKFIWLIISRSWEI